MKIKTLLPILGLTSVAAAAPVVASCAKPAAVIAITFDGSKEIELVNDGTTAKALTFHYNGDKKAMIAPTIEVKDGEQVLVSVKPGATLYPVIDDQGNFTIELIGTGKTTDTQHFDIKFVVVDPTVASLDPFYIVEGFTATFKTA